MTTDSVREQIEQLEERYQRLVEDVQRQLKELESKGGDLVDRVRSQLPDGSELADRARDVNADIRERVGLLADQAREAATGAREALSDAGDRLLHRGDADDDADDGGSTLAANPTKQELYAEATRLGISGRSSMSKAELAAAIAKDS